MKPSILHISGDFPDPINRAKTPVIASLLDLTAKEFDHEVVSINRKSPSPWETVRSFKRRGDNRIIARAHEFSGGLALQYSAPPYGIMHRTCLEKLGDELAERFEGREMRPRAIMGHKLTIEAIVARRMAEKLHVPFALTIQGNTDTKILEARPDLRPYFRRVIDKSRIVFSFAPWALTKVRKLLDHPLANAFLLPCPTDLDVPASAAIPGQALLSVFHLKHHRIKNLSGIGRALKLLTPQQSAYSFRVVGGGSAKDLEACRNLVRGTGVEFVGEYDRAELRRIMRESIALVLPSRRESFGLVFIEAIFAGLPIIYPRGAAVDGYFDDLPFAIPVNPGNPREIARAIQHVCENEATLKKAVCAWQESSEARRFTRASIAETFSSALTQLIQV